MVDVTWKKLLPRLQQQRTFPAAVSGGVDYGRPAAAEAIVYALAGDLPVLFLQAIV